MIGQQARPSNTLEQARAVLAQCRHPVCLDCDVRSVAVCAAVGPDMLPRLAAIATERSLEPEQVLFHEGDPAEDLFDA